MKKYPAWVMSGLLLFMAGKGAFAEQLDMFGASSRGAAMGSAMVAIAEGTEAAFYNSSALALSRESTSMEWNSFRSRLDVNGVNYGPGDTDFGMTPNLIGLNSRFLRERVGLGMLLAGTGIGGGGGGGGGEGIQLIGQGYGWGMYGGATIPLYYGLGLRLHDKLAVGFTQSTNLWLLHFSDIVLNIDDILGMIIGLSVGVPPEGLNPNIYLSGSTEPGPVGVNLTFKPIKYLSFGYVQKPYNWMRIKVPVILTSSGLLADDMRFIVILDVFNVPDKEQVGAGVHIPLPKSLLTLSWTQDHQFWGRMHRDTMKEYMRYTQPAISKLMTYSWGSTAEMDDISIDRYGMEYELDAKWLPTKFMKERSPKLFLRGGYFHWNSPLPDELSGRDFDSDADVYSGGLGLSLDRKGRKTLKDPSVSRRLSMDLHAQYFDIEPRNFKLQYDYWGDFQGDTSEYYYHTEGKIWNVGFQLTWWH